MLHNAPLAGLDGETTYRILALRVEVFVVEQRCAYPDLDGRDLEPGARWMWITSAGSPDVLATLRVLTEADGTARIGRVATASSARGAGLAGQLMRAALEAHVGRPVVLDAQSHLVSWYAGFGFVVIGPEYLEDNIPHVPMRRQR